MLLIGIVLWTTINNIVSSHSWNTSDGILPWESYIKLSDIQRPLGLKLDRSSLAHHHFAIGYYCLHSFMYIEAQEAFDWAIHTAPSFVEAHIGKMLACKHALWSYTDFNCGLTAYNTIKLILKISNITLTPFQSSLLLTVYQWYAYRPSIMTGERAFLSSITTLSKKYPKETDILVLLALSYLNVAFENDFEDEKEPTLIVEARKILNTVLDIEPNHPGALHYLIHVYNINQADITEKAMNYALTYNKTVLTLSYPHHLLAHIWIRTGAWLRAISSDRSAIETSMTLCAIKILKRPLSILSIELESVLAAFNSTDEINSFLQCDAENRGQATEWLSYSSLQVGDWLSSINLLNDLFIADQHSHSLKHHYLSYAYRTQARILIDTFFWYPYTDQFLNKTHVLLALNKEQSFVSLGNDTTEWTFIWSEAAYRFADCLRILTAIYLKKNASDLLIEIDNHLTRLALLADQSRSLNKYMSNSISIMISQILGMHHYINGLWQECLNEFHQAIQLESTHAFNPHHPTLVFARSSELLALHLLVIYEQYEKQTAETNSSLYKLNGVSTSIEKFPYVALNLYRKTDRIVPNRAVNTLGMARANVHLIRHGIAVGLYQQLTFQMTLSNNVDDSFLKEANEYLSVHSSALHCRSSLMLVFYLAMLCFYFIK